MGKSVFEVSGAEIELNAFRTELTEYLKSKNISPDVVRMSKLERARVKLTDDAPLGHLPLMQLLLEIGPPVAATVGAIITSVSSDLIKDYIREKLKQHRLKAVAISDSDDDG